MALITFDPSKESTIYFRCARNGSKKFIFVKSTDSSAFSLAGKTFEAFIKAKGESEDHLIDLDTSVGGTGNNELTISIDSDQSDIRPADYFFELVETVSDKTWITAIAPFTKDTFPGIDDSDETFQIVLDGDDVVISVSEAGGLSTVTTDNVTIQGDGSSGSPVALKAPSLLAIEALSGTSGFLTKTGVNTWALTATGGYWPLTGSASLTGDTFIDIGTKQLNIGVSTGLQPNGFVTNLPGSDWKYALWNPGHDVTASMAIGIGDLQQIEDLSYSGIFFGQNLNEITLSSQTTDGQTVEFWMQQQAGPVINVIFEDGRTIKKGIEYGTQNLAHWTDNTLITKLYADTKLITKTLPTAPGAGQDGQALRWNNGGSTWEYFTAASSLAIGNTIASSTSGGVLYVNSFNALAEDATNFFWDASQKRLGLGTNAPTGVLQTITTSTSTTRGAIFEQYNNGTESSRLYLRKYRGSLATPASIVTGDNLGNLVFSGYDGTTVSEAAEFRVTSTGAISSGVVPGIMTLRTANTSGVMTTAVTISEAQVITLANALPTTSGGTGNASYTAGDINYYASGTSFTKVAIGSAGAYLRSSGTAPLWSTLILPNAATSSRLVYATSTNTYGESASLTFDGTRLSPNYITLAASSTSAGTAPIKLTSGTLMTTAEAGGVEFLTDDLYFTITTGAARQKVALTAGLTSGRVTYATTNGRLTDSSLLTYNGSGQLTVGANMIVTAGPGADVRTPHIQGNSAAPSISAGAGAGTSPTVSISNGDDMSGIVNITTGTTPSSSSVVATITFVYTWGVAPNIQLTPANAATAALGTVAVYVDSNTTTFTINSGAVALTGSTAYKWFFHAQQ